MTNTPVPEAFYFYFSSRRRGASCEAATTVGQWYMQKALTKESPLFWNYWATIECAVLKCSVKCDVTNIRIFNIHMGFAIFRKKKTKNASLPKSTWKTKSTRKTLALICSDASIRILTLNLTWAKTSNFFKLYGSASSRSRSRSLFGGYLSLLLFLAFFPWESLWRRLYMAQLNKYKCL